MPVACDQLIGSEIVQERVEPREVLPGLRTIGPRLVVVARQQQCDRHGPHGVVHDGPVCGAPSLTRPFRWPVEWREARHINALLSQMILDGEGHWTLEAGRREDVARMTGVCQPLHDRAQALRHAGGWVTDAVVIHEEKPHN